MPKFNLPNKEDPDFQDKLIQLIKDLFEQNESSIKNFIPITAPEEGLQVGSMYFDTEAQKFKVNTSTGIKTISFDP